MLFVLKKCFYIDAYFSKYIITTRIFYIKRVKNIFLLEVKTTIYQIYPCINWNDLIKCSLNFTGLCEYVSFVQLR